MESNSEKLSGYTGKSLPLKIFSNHFESTTTAASAVVGLDGLQKVVYNAVTLFSRRTFPVFDDIEKAKDWLIEQ